MALSPEFFMTPEDTRFLQEFPERIKDMVQKPDTFLNYPIVYIHFWPSQTITYINSKGEEKSTTKYDVYVGESNDLIERTNQHHDTGKKAESEQDAWQYSLVNIKNNNEIPYIIVIGHKRFLFGGQLCVHFSPHRDFLIAFTGVGNRTDIVDD